MILEPKGKQRVCSTPLSYYDRVMSVGSKPIYMRYDVVQRILSPHLPTENPVALAEPVYDDADDSLHWYAWPPTHDEPTSLTTLAAGAERAQYEAQKAAFVAQVRAICKVLPDEERHIAQGVLNSLRDEYALCYDGRIALVAWGMHPCKDLYDPNGLVCVRTLHTWSLTFDYGQHGTPLIPTDRQRKVRKGAKLTPADLPGVSARDGYRFAGWSPSFDALEVDRNLLFIAQYEEVQSAPEAKFATGKSECIIHFATDGHATLSSHEPLTLPLGTPIPHHLLPVVTPHQGRIFAQWSPDPGQPLVGDITLTALTRQEPHCHCSFELGKHGQSTDTISFDVRRGSSLQATDIPTVRPRRGYTFTGWDRSPTAGPIVEDMVFVAQYAHTPWYVRWWRALRRLRIWRWLRWLLLLLLLLLLWLLLLWLLPRCDSHSSREGRRGDDRVDQVDTIRTGDGRRIDDNGSTLPGGDAPSIIGDDGRIPDHAVIPPIVGRDGKLPPVIQKPDEPDAVANRLNIYFDQANPDVEALIRDFKRLYPGAQYKVIGLDRSVPWVQIQIPEAERDAIRTRLPEQLKPHQIFVVDETLLRGDSLSSSSALHSLASNGWHLPAVQAPQAWQITRGSPSVRIAVVDDGLEVSHPMFANQKGLQAYNVFTRTARVAKGRGHGTHVAGIALGGHGKLSGGAAGIAPNCQLTVVQVGDNGHIPTSALISGIMYALNHGADVVNVSIGDMTRRISRLSEQEQRRMAQTRFKNRERVWNRIYDVARRRRAILVFAAGNESILAYVSPMLRSRYTVNVTATAPNGQLTPFSNYGTGSHIAAPGADIYSAVPGQRYESMDGTSMAAPIVTGAIALMRSLDSTLGVEQVVKILQATAKKTNRPESPLLQIADALRAVQRGASAQPGGGGPGGDAPGEGAPGRGEGGEAPVPPSGGSPTPPAGGGDIRLPDGTPVTPIPPGQLPPGPPAHGGINRDSILRLIREYQRRIAELQRQLEEER